MTPLTPSPAIPTLDLSEGPSGVPPWGTDVNGMQHRVGLEPARGLIAIEARQLDVHENEVRPMGSRSCQPCFAIHSFDDFEIGSCRPM